eukprot:gene14756-biopygen5796
MDRERRAREVLLSEQECPGVRQVQQSDMERHGAGGVMRSATDCVEFWGKHGECGWSWSLRSVAEWVECHITTDYVDTVEYADCRGVARRAVEYANNSGVRAFRGFRRMQRSAAECRGVPRSAAECAECRGVRGVARGAAECRGVPRSAAECRGVPRSAA